MEFIVFYCTWWGVWGWGGEEFLLTGVCRYLQKLLPKSCLAACGGAPDRLWVQASGAGGRAPKVGSGELFLPRGWRLATAGVGAGELRTSGGVEGAQGAVATQGGLQGRRAQGTVRAAYAAAAGRWWRESVAGARALGPQGRQGWRVQGAGMGSSRMCDRMEVGLAEGWACADSHALGVPLSAIDSPRAGQSAGALCSSPQWEGVCFLFVGDACKSSGQQNKTKTRNPQNHKTNTKGEELGRT